MAIIIPHAGEKRILASRFGRTLYEQDFHHPDGSMETYGLWGYEKESAVLIFPVTSSNHVVAIRQFRQGPNMIMLEIPGGIPDGNELIEETAIRELKEETGYVSRHVINLGAQPFLGPHCSYRFTPVLALDCIKTAEQTLDETEDVEVELIPLNEWYRKIWDGEILDNQMLGISMLAYSHLKNLMDQAPA